MAELDASAGRDCWRLGRGIALGLGDWYVGDICLSLGTYDAFEENPLCDGSSLEVMEAADIRLDNAILSLSSPARCQLK